MAKEGQFYRDRSKRLEKREVARESARFAQQIRTVDTQMSEKRKQIIKFGGKSKDAVSLRLILLRYSILHPFKYRKIKRQSRQIIEENDQLLEMLGSDYDDNNSPYWENTES